MMPPSQKRQAHIIHTQIRQERRKTLQNKRRQQIKPYGSIPCRGEIFVAAGKDAQGAEKMWGVGTRAVSK